MYRIQRRFQFCCGHRVYKHESKCAHIHGHNYVMLVEVAANYLDSIGRVIDFSEVKRIIAPWIDEFIDHNFVCFAEDPIREAVELYSKNETPYVMDTNPTAENMAKHFAEVFQRMMPAELRITRIQLWETENCMAEWVA